MGATFFLATDDGFLALVLDLAIGAAFCFGGFSGLFTADCFGMCTFSPERFDTAVVVSSARAIRLDRLRSDSKCA